MLRFALFEGDRYYPAGGWKDFFCSYATIEEAQYAARLSYHDWYQIVDLTTGEIVERRDQE